MSSYRIDELSVDQLGRIVLPKFQRGFVWTKKKQEDFIQTLHDGYPFGTLLVYPENDNDKDAKLQLLDGQQRLSTIQRYQQNPLQFWKPLNRDSYLRTYRFINGLLPDDGKLTEPAFDALVNQNDPNEVTYWAMDALGSKDDVKSVIHSISDLKQQIRAFVNLDHLKVPMIVYLGGSAHIADVFANLNKGGVPLTKYEVFGAAWVNATIHLQQSDSSPLQDQILQYVKNYYLDMRKRAEFDLDNFSEDDLTSERIITLSELGMALGQYIVDHLSALVPETSSAVPELGFGLLGVAVKIDNRRLGELNKYTNRINESLEDILQKTERICNNLQSLFDAILKRFKSSGNEYENGLSSTFKTLSYFAALWDLDPSSEEYRESLSNIKSAYVYDAITSVWTSHGDQRLMEYGNGSRDYRTALTREQFRQAFDQWIADQTPGINFGKDVKCLVTIHANLSYLSASVPNGESFELEHIVARKRINEAETSRTRRILGNSIGNCMYLPRGINNPKKDKTLYEINDHSRYSQLIKESQYFSEEQMGCMLQALDRCDYEEVNSLLSKRSREVAYTLVDVLLKDTVQI